VSARIAVSLLIVTTMVLPAGAAVGPTRPDTPTGCASNIFELEVQASPEWGVIPFRALVSVNLQSLTDQVEGVWWDFDGDGHPDAVGQQVSYVFDLPQDYVVTAHVTTRERGEVRVEKVVSGHTGIMSLTFDDGCASVYDNAMPMLGARRLVATAYIVPSWVKDYNPVLLSWDDIWELYKLGWDIGSHTMTHVSLLGADDSTLHYELGESLRILRAHGFDPVSFSLPFGQYDQRALDAVRMYYRSCRAVGHSLNPPVEFADPYMLLCKTSQQWLPLATYTADIDGVSESRGWYILNNHRVWNDCYSAADCIDTQMLADVVDYALARRLRVTSVRNALDYRRTMEMNARVPAGWEDAPETGVAAEWAFANPFALPGTIEFRLPEPATATAQIYDCAGRLVRNLGSSATASSDHRVFWDGRNGAGVPVASGAYYCVIAVAGETYSSGAILILR
jgi:peptidoglycan/xylan/chitin deacetylase (PgdA/CDA1 family)